MSCPRVLEFPSPPPGKTGWPWTEESPAMPARMPNGEPWPRVSVVTPSYNQAQFIEETIRSVLLQGYPNLEYIIIDGGSTDGSLDIIHKYQPWLSYWISEPDRGQTHAVNKGWANATGEILAYINSDDCYQQGAVAAAVEGFCANPPAVMVYGSAIVVDETGKKLRAWEGKPFDLKVMLTVGSIVPQPATFFSGNILKKVSYLDEKWHMIMDYELCIRIGLQFPVVCLPVTLARFRDHSQSKTNMRFEATATELIHFLATFFPEQVPAKKMQAIKRETVSRIHYEWALAYLEQGRQQPSKALRQLLNSIVRYPFFAAKQPLDIAYILKEVLLSYFTAIRIRFTIQCSERHVLR